MSRTFEAAAGVIAVDTVMCGRPEVTSAYLLEADAPAVVETGPTTSVETLVAGLRSLGIGPDDLAHIVVTHIHLDHAGGAGAMAARFPRATVWVHERGAPHLADPTRLMASATRIYGEERLLQMFGAVDPVPAGRLRAVTDRDRLDLGGRTLEVVYTPGHASHHVCLHDSASDGVFVGDALGVFLPDVGALRPATPPPEFDLEQAVRSVRRVAERDPSRILFSHFGPVDDVEGICRLAIERLERWTSIVEETLGEFEDTATVVRALREATAGDLDTVPEDRRAEVEDRNELLSSYEMNALGIIRYLRKSREAAAAERAPSD